MAQKRKISANQIVKDIKCGLDDEAMVEKYSLSAEKLEKIYQKLIQAGALTKDDLESRQDDFELDMDIGTSDHQGKINPTISSAKNTVRKEISSFKKEITDEIPSRKSSVQGNGNNLEPETHQKKQAEAKQPISLLNLDPDYRNIFYKLERSSKPVYQQMNWWAFVFGIFWYVYKGMWLKGLLYQAMAITIGIITIPGGGVGGLLVLFLVAYMGNHDYYLWAVHGEQGFSRNWLSLLMGRFPENLPRKIYQANRDNNSAEKWDSSLEDNELGTR